MRPPFSSLFLALVLPFAAAQTVTTTDLAGETIIENITLDPNGLPTTVILQTLAGDAAAAGAATTTITTTDPAGETVVEVITGDGAGDSVTNTIQTIAAAVDPAGPGPVGQPGPTGAAGLPTPFTYTTTDANGNTVPVVATFTPSVATAVPVSATFQATVLGYSEYTASYATQIATVANAKSNNNSSSRRSPKWWGPCLSVMIGMAGGMLLILGA
ncbi:hypothetical protein C8F04DRAFT_1065976 [Mycena alexandri]|uniref:Uncharacterized protein n=1 Tax=Mycena alexandri TaxID=1745969 RepID=A0AAD6TGN5_9AGAR|nr:hypothetical protein C8F04DRAFT_1065976 [Mycena alexandri]